MSKLFLHTITHNCLKDIDEMTQGVWELFDGIIAVDDFSTDGTYQLLVDRNNDDGCITQSHWVNDFSFSRNLALLNATVNPAAKEGLKELDWVCILDSPERINKDFVVDLKTTLIPHFEKNNVNTIYQRSKPILFRWFKDIRFVANPHTGLQNVRKELIDLSHYQDFQDDKKYIWSERNNELSWVKASAYYFYFPSNHCQLVYEPQRFPENPNASKLAQEHEYQRHVFMDYLRNELKIETTKEAMIKYMSDPLKWPEFFIGFMQTEKILCTFFRYYVLKQDYKQIFETEDTWSINEYLKETLKK